MVNIILSDFFGEKVDSSFRYCRSCEVVEILKKAWICDQIDYDGEVYSFYGLMIDFVCFYQIGGLLFYFGGYFFDVLELCGQYCDVYLMWFEFKDQIVEWMKVVNVVVECYGCMLDYGLCVYVIVCDMEVEVCEYVEYIILKFDDEMGCLICECVLDVGFFGVLYQVCVCELVDQYGYVEWYFWIGIGWVWLGCGVVIVGFIDQVLFVVWVMLVIIMEIVLFGWDVLFSVILVVCLVVEIRLFLVSGMLLSVIMLIVLI